MRNKSPFNQPATVFDCDQRRSELVQALLLFEGQLLSVKPESKDDYDGWKSKVKSGICKIRREISWLNSIKSMYRNNIANDRKTVAPITTTVPSDGKTNRQNLIGKAFFELCNDVIAGTVPDFNSTKALSSHYLILAESPDGNQVSVLETAEENTEDDAEDDGQQRFMTLDAGVSRGVS